MEAAHRYIDSGAYFVPEPYERGGLLEGTYTSHTFWEKFEEITGKKPEYDEANFFSCSC